VASWWPLGVVACGLTSGSTTPSSRIGDPFFRPTGIGQPGTLSPRSTLHRCRDNEVSAGRRGLVTLTGIGGVGKTQLVLRAAADVAADFPDRVRLVELGELRGRPGRRGVEPRVSAVEGPPSRSARLLVMRGPNAGSQFRLDQPVTSAGRHPGSDIFLDDVTVSRHHAEFRLENGQFRLVDLDSLNSTYVNHEPVDSAVLVDGDEIQIGKFRLMFLTRPTTG
jgi:FHA domain